MGSQYEIGTIVFVSKKKSSDPSIVRQWPMGKLVRSANGKDSENQ